MLYEVITKSSSFCEKLDNIEAFSCVVKAKTGERNANKTKNENIFLII